METAAPVSIFTVNGFPFTEMSAQKDGSLMVYIERSASSSYFRYVMGLLWFWPERLLTGWSVLRFVVRPFLFSSVCRCNMSLFIAMVANGIAKPAVFGLMV